MTFSQPVFLWFSIFTLPAFLGLSLLMRRQQRMSVGRFGKPQTLRRFSRFTSAKSATAVVFSLALASLALSAAGPRLENSEDSSSKTLNAVVVLDISRSMLTPDGPEGRTRLEAGILAVEELLAAYPDGRFGLVLYTDRVFGYAPTFDHQALHIIFADILNEYGHVRGEGSHPAKAMEEAAKIIAENPYTVDVVFLVSDGGKSLREISNLPTAATAIRELNDAGVLVVGTGVGGLVPAPIPVYDEDGELVGYHRYAGAVVYSALEEPIIRQFAERTGGYYLHMKDTGDLVKIVRAKKLDSQPVAQETETNLVWLPVAFALALIFAWLLAKNFKMLVRPRTS